MLHKVSRAGVVFAALLLALQPTYADEPAPTPRQLIENLGVEVTQILDGTKRGAATPEDAERAVADRIAALVRSAEGHPSLNETDPQGRTPLMLAIGGAYPQVVQALLTDPSVRLRINVPDADGVTPWMLANFAPTLTLVACQPGVLTASRYPVLTPYLYRQAHLLKTKGAAIGATIRMLEEAGAEPKPEDAQRAWLARCHNARPELRQALAGGELMPTLISESLTRRREFHKAWQENPKRVPAEPPAGMKFVLEPPGSAQAPGMPLMKLKEARCTRRIYPKVEGMPEWHGEIIFRAVVAMNAGVVQTVDIEPRGGPYPADVVDHFRGAVLSALTYYLCLGNEVFEQEFLFKID